MEDINDAPECDNPRGSVSNYGSVQDEALNGSQDISKEDLLLAATYVEDARLGRHSYFKSNNEKLRLYRLYNHPVGKIVLTFLLISHMSLALFEKPTISSLKLSNWLLLPIEFLIIFCYSSRLMHIRLFSSATRFWSDTKNILLVILILGAVETNATI